MPYAENADLPTGVRHALPAHAQDIYRSAFNAAWQSGRYGRDEAVLHRIAWAAVKRRYRKLGESWVPRS